MSIELTILISVLSFSFAVYSGISNMKRNAKKDTAEDAAQLTTVIVKLENINNGISEMNFKNCGKGLWWWSNPLNPPTIALTESGRTSNETGTEKEKRVFQADHDWCGGRYLCGDGLHACYGMENEKP